MRQAFDRDRELVLGISLKRDPPIDDLTTRTFAYQRILVLGEDVLKNTDDDVVVDVRGRGRTVVPVHRRIERHDRRRDRQRQGWVVATGLSVGASQPRVDRHGDSRPLCAVVGKHPPADRPNDQMRTSSCGPKGSRDSTRHVGELTGRTVLGTLADHDADMDAGVLVFLLKADKTIDPV